VVTKCGLVGKFSQFLHSRSAAARPAHQGLCEAKSRWVLSSGQTSRLKSAGFRVAVGRVSKRNPAHAALGLDLVGQPGRQRIDDAIALPLESVMWHWAVGLVDGRAPRKLLGRRQFERRARRQLATGHGRPGTLLFVEVDRLNDAERVLGCDECEQIVTRLAELVVAIASNCPATLVTKDAFLVYAQDLTFSLDIAESIRVAAQQEFAKARRKVLAHYGQSGSPASLDEHVLTVTVGACAVMPRQDFEEAIRRAEDTLLEAKQAGGNQVLWSSIG